MRTVRQMQIVLAAGIAAMVGLAGHAYAANQNNPAGEEFFEKQIRPVLSEHCFSCHSAHAKSLKGQLRLDSWAGMQRGGESGRPAVVADSPDKSQLLIAIRYTDTGTADRDPLRMPPAKAGHSQKLPDSVIADFQQWIEAGAPHPKSFDEPPKEIASGQSNDPSEHWAFKKPVEPAVPTVKDAGWVKDPIDNFILAKLEEKRLTPSAPADRRTLIRRAYFDLIGLPPSPQEVADFQNDSSPDAFAKIVDHLLASPRYGERWGRYWLDIARYADTKGYVFQEERKYPYAYTYRDWVIKAFNDDLPYDRFLIDQIAADQLNLPEKDKGDLAAMGFLTLGRRFLNNKPDIIDDRLDVAFRGTMAMTIGCARCHDHKFDPIPTKDYYSLYAVFNNSVEPTNLPLIGEPEETPAYVAFKKELDKRQAAHDTYVKEKLQETLADLRSPNVIAAYLMAATTPDTRQAKTDGKVQINRFLVARWRAFLKEKADEKDSVFALWRKYASIPDNKFAEKAGEIAADSSDKINPLVSEEFEKSAPQSLSDVAKCYAELLVRYDKPDKLEDANAEQLRQVLRGEDSPAKLPAGVNTDRLLRRDFRDHATQLQKRIDEFKASNPAAPPRAMVLDDSTTIEPQRVFMRGNPNNVGAPVKAHFLSVVDGPNPPLFKHGSGRLEMARAIASKDNPLTARVMVNRIWLHHFGRGIVHTPSDFGMRADPPTHPELLDWLAIRFMKDGWSIKAMHRLIMLSSVYQESSLASDESLKIDPTNDLLSHMNRQRLDFEAMRDSLIWVTGKMDKTMGGRSVDITVDPSPRRRTVYAFIDRQNLPGLFRNFDYASPDATSPRRFSTTVPQQALFMLNSPFMIEQVRSVLARPEIAEQKAADARIGKLYQLLFERAPTPEEVTLGRTFVDSEATHETPVVWQYGYGQYDAAAQRVTSFTALPHFTGRVWQGGPTLPDGKIGYASLTSDGGHPGDDARHAVIRRWTSPIDGSVRISGTIARPDARGDGVHAVIVSSRLGEIASWNVLHGEAETSISSVAVKKGDQIDFVVDCRGNPQYDSFTWAPVIHANSNVTTAGTDGPEQWSAAAQFSGNEKAKALSPWEKYVQVLMESNEFVFID